MLHGPGSEGDSLSHAIYTCEMAAVVCKENSGRPQTAVVSCGKVPSIMSTVGQSPSCGSFYRVSNKFGRLQSLSV